eukprot:837522-Pyramimonas_sp.AAC.1
MAKRGKRGGQQQKREYFVCSNPKCGGWGYCDVSQFCGQCGKKFQGRGKGRGDDGGSSQTAPAGANRWKGGKHAAGALKIMKGRDRMLTHLTTSQLQRHQPVNMTKLLTTKTWSNFGKNGKALAEPTTSRLSNNSRRPSR